MTDPSHSPIMRNRWLSENPDRGPAYDAAFEERARTGHDVHGEAGFVAAMGPRRVLDAGCGTGRVAIELARRGVEVCGVDLDPSMLDVARSKAPHLEWHLADLEGLDLRDPHTGEQRRFDVAVMAGNVMIFVTPGREGAILQALQRHLAVPGGALVAGFQLLAGRLDLATYDALAAAAGLRLRGRWATWDRDPYRDGDYAVSVHEPAS